ncbi:enhancer of mRNA-decapping protein 4 isoform X1 [Physcomitrium patens]|uniref:Enhancer of mRNA-decapping protein 4 WD40 repeat region domain-containing protein n=1 Tax=Physcomitrium patens TaxID=3218 RepID=A0A7I4AYQ0_PHYPA|nr:enhancer of mRNA-decapping protein 4-like isoform X1 [Physcomitrium patens]XP_024397428.1 enhancer of mRNA-decapping protein 4-like isoform X1 [Physcomitrium patens]XP_024397429.1 enhancer of mRNA-decapping protein 4-like isoform X1 [Physcomitrium patens]XP_024397430.1 enhancer of mRNA-decapping protein 4-like isoform X1 [Physcomitrium patens]XP_024397431.1 enhancer of mRNA-decapping protein 4-like isoform X1 [Physcomitrium patens]|eukprot:XP_024397427.1 enhancer of mRNA-decapping protein 4-like isoform X1 [Physcomitrella patens]
MGATGPSGGFDIHNFFNNPPPSPYPPPQYSSHPPYPAAQFPQNSGPFPTNSGSFPSMPPQNFQYSSSQQQQEQTQVFHPYMHYQQEHGQRPSSYTTAPYNQHQQQQQVQFPPPGALNSLHGNPPLSSLPLSSLSQGSGGPNQAPSSPLDGARLMALLTTHGGAEAPSSDDGSLVSGVQQSGGERPRSTQDGSQDVSIPPPALAPALPTAPPAPAAQMTPTASGRASSGKQPRGRHLWGDHVVYDVDVRKPGEAQPQLEVSPITVYGSDPQLVVGRQIAVNKKYICYGLRQGTIRILNINTALRALLRGHTQRVTDMAFLSEDQHLLASASVDGRIYVRRILEGQSAEGSKVLITEQILLAIQFVGGWESCHPRVCWNLQTEDVLEVAIGPYVLSIDVGKVQQAAPPGGFLVDQPLQCQVENPVEGVCVVGGHDGTVTDLAVPSFSTSRVASASQDGTVRIWGDTSGIPLLSIMPHGGDAVCAVAFLSAPRRPDHHVLLTAGPLNRELKLWAPSSGPEESPSKVGTGTGAWRCIQTLEFQSSDVADGYYEDTIFNQLVVASRASLILLANAKKNAIYAVHVEFGHNPAAARMNYLAEFSVKMPILSLTVAEDSVTEAGEGKVQIYCVQTQAIQQYGLDVSQCLPPVEGSMTETPGTPERSVLPGAQDSGRSDQTGVPDLIDMGPASGVSTGASSTPNVSVPARNPAVSSAFGSPVEVGRLEVPSAHHVEKSIAVDFNALLQSSTKAQNKESGKASSGFSSSAELRTQMSGKAESTPAGNTKPPTSRRSRSRSPTRAPDSHHVSMGSKQKGEDIQEMRPEAPPLMPPLDVSNLDRAQSNSSSTSAEEVLDRVQEKGALADSASVKSSNSSQQGGQHQGLHLITPSELMNLAAGSKHGEAYGAPLSVPGQEQSSRDGKAPLSKGSGSTDGFIGMDSNVDMEKEVVESKVSVVEDDISGKEVLVSSLLESLETTQMMGNDYVDKEPSVPQDSMDRYAGENSQVEEGEVSEDKERPLIGTEDVNDRLRDLSFRDGGGEAALPPPQAAIAKGRKNKNKTSAGGIGSSSVLSSQMPSMMASGLKPVGEASHGMNPVPASTPTSAVAPAPTPIDPAFLAQVASMQESLNQLVSMQKEIQKQMTVMVAVPVAKEGKRMEGALGQRMEKVLKAHVDAMWARLAEENARREKQERERVQQVTTMLTNFVSKDMPVALERGVKKEFAAIGPVVAQAVLPPLHKAVSTTVAESFQGFTEKMLPQLEKSVGAKLEGTVTRQIQTQFQTIGRQVLQEALRSCFESTVLPAFERTCRTMLDHVESSFQHGMSEYTQHAQEQLLSSHSDLASTLKDTVASATVLADSLKGELAEGQKKLMALAESASANAARALPANNQINGGLPDKVRIHVLSLQHLEESLDPTIELSRLLKENKLEEAFNKALSLSDVAVVSWLCMQLDEDHLFRKVPLPLSQGVLLSLVQQLGCDLGKDTDRKLSWIREAALALNPEDPLLAPHMRPFLQQLYQSLHRQLSLSSVPGEQVNLRLVMHVVHSLLTSCKQ